MSESNNLSSAWWFFVCFIDFFSIRFFILKLFIWMVFFPSDLISCFPMFSSIFIDNIVCINVNEVMIIRVADTFVHVKTGLLIYKCVRFYNIYDDQTKVLKYEWNLPKCAVKTYDSHADCERLETEHPRTVLELWFFLLFSVKFELFWTFWHWKINTTLSLEINFICIRCKTDRKNSPAFVPVSNPYCIFIGIGVFIISKNVLLAEFSEGRRTFIIEELMYALNFYLIGVSSWI